MSNSSAYFERKAAELECLAGYAAEPRIERVPSTHHQVIDQKLRLKVAIRQKNINPLWGMSNITGERFIDCHGFDIRYTYQRSSFRLNNPDHLELLYQNLACSKDHVSQGYLTNCGQVSISLLFHVLGSYHQKFTLETRPDDIYFETSAYLEDTKLFESGGESKRIVFLDSSTLGKGDWDDLNFAPEVTLVIVDTTAYPLSSPRLAEILNLALDQEIPCALVRSHLKLDSLGMEYSSLGSLCLVYRQPNTLCDFINEKFPKALSNMGGFATPKHIFPFYLDPEYQRLNNDRLSKVHVSNRAFYQLLQQKDMFSTSEKLGLRDFDHDMFCWISIQPNMGWDPFIDRLLEWTRSINDSGLPCRLTESFGWDFIALSAFRPDDGDQSNARLADKIWNIRVSIPDIQSSDFTPFADELVGLLAGLRIDA